MKLKTAAFAAFFLCLFFSFVFAAFEKKLEFRWKQRYRHDLNRSAHKLYVDRLSLTLNYLDIEAKSLFKITPFFELRWNLNKDLTEKKELGIELGRDIFPWFYLGEGIQQVWLKEDSRHYKDYERRDYLESKTRILFSHDLLPERFIKIKGFILDEYIYDFKKDKGSRNEVAIGVIIPIGKYLETDINWRHIDRIHYYDSDTVEVSLTWIF